MNKNLSKVCIIDFAYFALSENIFQQALVNWPHASFVGQNKVAFIDEKKRTLPTPAEALILSDATLPGPYKSNIDWVRVKNISAKNFLTKLFDKRMNFFTIFEG